jgi:hypothetical protein
MKLDAGRLSELRVFSEAELRRIGADAAKAIATQLQALDRALAAEDLAAAGEASHRARNETLLVGARELDEALAALQQAARDRQLERARAAAARARSLWPPTRAALAELALAAHEATD